MNVGKREPSIEQKFAEKRNAWSRRPAALRTRHRVYEADGRIMAELGMEPSVHLIVTSPPYWNLKEYPDRPGNQLGNLSDYAEFLSEMESVWRRCFQLLVPGGRMCVVVGDVCLSRKKAGRHSVKPLHADFSRQCMESGFDYLTPILWYKIANATTEVEGNGAGFLGKPYEPNAVIKNDVEYILLFRKPGSYRTPTSEQRALSVIERADHDRWFRQIWTDVPGQSRLLGHPAPFPKELAFRLISMFSFVDDTVLDPFWGTGTTTAAAIDAHRSSVGYEIEPRYLQIGQARFQQKTIEADVEFISKVNEPPPMHVAEMSKYRRRRAAATAS